MNKYFNNLAFLLPVMFYYAIEAFVVGMFITLIWRFTLSNIFGYLEYFQIVGIYWIIKMLLFDVFKLIAGLGSMNNEIPQQDDEQDENNNYGYSGS